MPRQHLQQQRIIVAGEPHQYAEHAEGDEVQPGSIHEHLPKDAEDQEKQPDEQDRRGVSKGPQVFPEQIVHVLAAVL